MLIRQETIGGFQTFPVQFGREGQALDDAQSRALEQALQASGATDLLALSHGWNNDEAEAHALYAELLGNLQQECSHQPLASGKVPLVLLVYWPSKRFADEDLIPGGAAGVADEDERATRAIDAKLQQLLDAFTGPGRDDPDMRAVLQQLRELAPRLNDDAEAQSDFVSLVRSVFTSTATEEEAPLLDDNFFTAGGDVVLSRLGRRVRPPRALAQGGAPAGVPDLGQGATLAQGQAAGLGNLFSGIKNGAFNLLNLFTYYEMKERAGRVGRDGLAPLLARLHQRQPGLRLHLCGHSFGGRLMAATLAALPANTGVRSLTLLQAAFSHWGFAQKYDGSHNGFFRAVFESGRLAGPMLVTHTKNDTAVGLAYPLASRLRNQIAEGLGDENDPFGGIGRNGAQKTAEVDPSHAALLDVGERYGPLQPGRVYNLEASAFISNHGDVRNPKVAHALWSALRAIA